MSLLEVLGTGSAEWRTFSVDAGLSEPLTMDVFVCRGAAAEPLALITAGVHGDEYEGPHAVAAIARILRPKRMPGSVIGVPVANPMAFAGAQRLSPADQKNLARCFPGQANGSPTQRLAHWFFEQFASRATHLIDLHSGGVEYRFVPVAGFYGGAAADNASFEAARRFGLDHLWQLPATEGVLSCELWKRGVTAIGCEYLGAGQLSDVGSRAYTHGVLSCLAHWGVVETEHALPPGGQPFQGDWHLASAEGIFHCSRELGCRVAPGDTVAEILDCRGEVRQQFVSSSAGVVLGLRSKAYLRKGDWGVLIGSPLTFKQ